MNGNRTTALVDRRLWRSVFKLTSVLVCVSLLCFFIIPILLRPIPSVTAQGTPGLYRVQAGPYPASQTTYGTRGYAKPRHTYVDEGSFKVESVWVDGPGFGTAVEVGWNLFYGGEPEFFAQYLLGGVPYECDHNERPTENVFHHFQVVGVAGQTTWAYYLDGGQPICTSPSVGFYYGVSGGQGEKHNTGDSCFTRWYGLQLQTFVPPSYYEWRNWPGPMQELLDEDNSCFLCKVSNTEFIVKFNGAACP
ncbi:MAG: hypothetical protein IT330_01180 [Anaerolineae bacterium]|nr:hypothetical protein [Anaerolineae bacterium]